MCAFLLPVSILLLLPNLDAQSSINKSKKILFFLFKSSRVFIRFQAQPNPFLWATKFYYDRINSFLSHYLSMSRECLYGKTTGAWFESVGVDRARRCKFTVTRFILATEHYFENIYV